MFRSNTVRIVFLLSVGTIAGFPLSAPAADDGPAILPPPDQPAASRTGPEKGGPPKAATQIVREAVENGPKQPRPAKPSGNRHCAARLGFPRSAPPPATSPAIPGLGNSCDRMEELTFRVASARSSRAPDHIGIQINTPDGPFEINVPRRHRAPQDVNEPPGPDGEAPLPGGRAGVNSGRASREFTVASHVFRAGIIPPRSGA